LNVAGALVADWLALHGINAEDCRNRLRQMPVDAAPPAPDPAFPSTEVLPMIIAALGRAWPDAVATLGRIGADVRIDLSPDLSRFPRAFTLHDDGRGLPFVSCPIKGRVSDLLVLAHEIGHACQILASGQPDLPPVLRETAAYLAEEVMLVSQGPTVPGLTTLHRTRTARMMRRDGAALLRALQAPETPYDYGWNYPIARDLAQRAGVRLAAAEQWQVFSSKIGLPRLLQLAPA
jgi:hypothetical protein